VAIASHYLQILQQPAGGGQRRRRRRRRLWLRPAAAATSARAPDATRRKFCPSAAAAGKLHDSGSVVSAARCFSPVAGAAAAAASAGTKFTKFDQLTETQNLTKLYVHRLETEDNFPGCS
jgi:hypothetical protein